MPKKKISLTNRWKFSRPIVAPKLILSLSTKTISGAFE
jgi:hypothetical protein